MINPYQTFGMRSAAEGVAHSAYALFWMNRWEGEASYDQMEERLRRGYAKLKEELEPILAAEAVVEYRRWRAS